VEHRDTLARILRWAALITSTLVLTFLVFMLVGHLTGKANGPNGMRFANGADATAFVFFPVLTIAGLLLAYKWELAGAVVVLVSLAGLFTLRPDLLRTPFWFWATPAICHLGHWWSQRGRG
jgi:arginine exporter protein ArgO